VNGAYPGKRNLTPTKPRRKVVAKLHFVTARMWDARLLGSNQNA
jgi:hypothetical protein